MSNEELVRRYRDGDEEAINKLLERNFGLITSFLKTRFPTKCYDKDYIQEGRIGIVIAANKFDLDKGIKFSTYATIWIKQKIYRYYANDKLIKVPEYIQSRVPDWEIVGDEWINFCPDCDDLLVKHDILDIVYKELDKIEPISKLIFEQINLKGEKVSKLSKMLKKDVEEIINTNEKVLKMLRKRLNEKGYNKEEL